MPEGKYKSRTFRRLRVKTPSGKTVMHYARRKPAKPKCAVCHQVLSGVPQGRPSAIQKLAKSSRRPERPYGGYTCSSCTKKILIEKARAEQIVEQTIQ